MNEALNANMTKNKLSTKGGVKLINKSPSFAYFIYLFYLTFNRCYLLLYACALDKANVTRKV